MLYSHVVRLGLEWWAAIAVATAAIRVLMVFWTCAWAAWLISVSEWSVLIFLQVPVVIKGIKSASKMAKIK